jgi:hypothetical protein
VAAERAGSCGGSRLRWRQRQASWQWRPSRRGR